MRRAAPSAASTIGSPKASIRLTFRTRRPYWRPYRQDVRRHGQARQFGSAAAPFSDAARGGLRLASARRQSIAVALNREDLGVVDQATNLVLTGIITDVCVDTTMRDVRRHR